MTVTMFWPFKGVLCLYCHEALDTLVAVPVTDRGVLRGMCHRECER